MNTPQKTLSPKAIAELKALLIQDTSEECINSMEEDHIHYLAAFFMEIFVQGINRRSKGNLTNPVPFPTLKELSHEEKYEQYVQSFMLQYPDQTPLPMDKMKFSKG
jgi:hypothetical protein